MIHTYTVDDSLYLPIFFTTVIYMTWVMLFKQIAARQQDEELRRHENQAEESRISLAKNKMRNESVEVALGERGKFITSCILCFLNVFEKDKTTSYLLTMMGVGHFIDHVSVTLPNPVLLAEKSEALFAEFGQGPGVRRALEINAPIPQLVKNSSRQQQNGGIPALELAKLQRLAGAVPSKAQFLERCRHEASLWVSNRGH